MRYSSPPKRRRYSKHKKGDPVAASVASSRAPTMEEVADMLDPTIERASE
jgi:hypothetical protein